MGISYNKIQVRIHLKNIVRNYRTLNQKGGCAYPVIKADAYGHGLLETAAALAKAGAHTLAVGTVNEAVSLREAPFNGRILSLLGPVDHKDYEAIAAYGILALAYRSDQLELLRGQAKKQKKPLPVALKFDTGMARLGFGPEDVPELVDRLKAHPELELSMVCSHLATADQPADKKFVLDQGKRFQDIVDELKRAGLRFESSLANSACVLAYPDLLFESQRPGISLYGANPFWGTDWEDKGFKLVPAMEVTAPVLQVHGLRRGTSISYGRAFTADKDMRVGVVAAGYADAYSRGLSNKGIMLLHGKRAPVVGRVCMQLTAVDVTDIPETRAGDRAYLLGGEGEGAIRPEELAHWWGTIPYEVFCMLGLNPREYI